MADTVKKISGRSRPYERIQKRFEKPSKTRQSEMAHTDLKTLVRRWEISGAPPIQMQYGDVSGLPTSRLEAMERIDDGIKSFLALPLKVRQAVDNNPRLLEQWIVSNPQLARDAGLLAPLPTQSPTPPENPPSSGTEEGKKDAGA